ncbi:MAG: flagellin, partial [Candidatus Hydrogenedentes bacterium]|nr:flagellin [Candidatus Hydrogenedentota bacterium]
KKRPGFGLVLRETAGMGLQINGPGGSLFALRQLDRSTRGIAGTQERLSSLLRINRAADDAAGLAIVEGFRSEVRQLNAEVRGIQTGVNLIQTAEGSLGAQSDAVSRIRELAVQAANGTLSDDQRQALNGEAQQLLQEIDATAQNTEFNGLHPLDGSTGTITLDAEGDLDIQFSESTVDSLGLNGLDISTQAGASAALSTADAALDRINQNRSALGAQESGLAAAADQRSLQSLNLQEAESRLRDLDVAEAFVEQTRNQVLLQGGISVLAQANLQNETAATLLGG